MAGPSVVVRLLADVKGLVSGFTEAGTKAESAASKGHAAFSGMLGALNQTGVLGPFSSALAGIDTAIQNIGAHGKGISTGLIGAGGALAGVGAGLATLGSKDQAAHAQLQQSVEATGKSYDDYAEQVDKAIKHQEKFGDTASQTQDSLRILTQATGDPAKALSLLNTATDLAAAKHEDLSTAATQLGKAYNGSAKILKEFGITAEKAVDTTGKVDAATKAAQTADENASKAKQHLADVQASLHGKAKLTEADQIRLRDAQQKVTDAEGKAVDAHKKLADTQTLVISKTQAAGDNMDQLAAKLKGQASAAANTFSGHLEALKATIEDSAASLGQKYGPAITALGTGMAGLGSAMKAGSAIMGTFTKGQEAAAAATDVMSASEDAAAVSEGLALAPILLIVAGIALLVAAGYLIYRNWDTIWSGIKSIIEGVWNWIKTNWPLLVSIILGPFAVAAYEIYKHWDAIKKGATEVWQWVRARFEDLLGYFIGLPKRLGAIWDGIWGGLKSGARAAFNFVADAWNATVGALSFHVPSWVPVLGGKGFDVPDIPHFAGGGIVTSPTLALIGEAGPEAVVPLGRGLPGPVMHIEHATFNDPVDVEVLSRQIEFALSAGLPV